MRIQPWIKAAFGALALAAGMNSAVEAQFPGYQPPYTTNQPQQIYPPGMPPQNMQPWPMVSPYQSANIASDTTYQGSNGLWYREILNRRTDWIISAEAIALRYRDAGGAIIGSPYVPIDYQINAPAGQPFDPSLGEFTDAPPFAPATPGFLIGGSGVFPIPLVSAPGSLTDADTIELVGSSIRNAGIMGDPNAAGGIKGSTGFFNEDGSGLMFSAWWADQGREDFSKGFETINGIPVTQAVSTSFGFQNLSPAIGMLPLNNGSFFLGLPSFGPGSTTKFDILYQTSFSSQAAGSNLSFYLPPVARNGGFSVRPMWGARYLYINERFTFRGIDSGFNYAVDGTGGGGGGANAGSSFRPIAPFVQLYSQYEADLSNTIKSQLAGPEIGFRLDLGEERGPFHMYTETIFGLVANYQKAYLNGNNIGDPLADVRINGPVLINGLPEAQMLASNAAFNEVKDGTHVSPVFHQSVFADFDLFGNAPYLNRVDLLENTRLRLGYTLMYAGSVARPADSIDWKGFPLFPSISMKYTNWWAHQLSASIDWTF